MCDKDGNTALHTAAKVGNVEILRVIVTHSDDVNVCNSLKKTPLLLAAERGSTECCAELFKHGGSVEDQTMVSNIDSRILWR